MTSLPRRLLAKVVTLRTGEATTALLMFAYSFLAMTSYNILKPVTRSKFIATLGADNLPYVQLAAGLLIGVLMHLYGRAADRIPRRWLVPLTQALEAVALLVFWGLFKTGAPWVPVAFYVAGFMLGVLLISQFWTLANDVYDPRQAKRLFGFIGGGASLGGATGAGLTTLAVDHVGTNNLLLVSSALLVACVAVVAVIARQQDSWKERTPVEERGVGGGEALRLLRDSRHLQVISLVVASATIGATIIDQQLNMAAEAIKGATSTDAITSFLAEVTFYTSIIGFVVQVALTSRIHRLLGIGFALLMLPLGLGTTAMIILFNGALWAPAAARVLDSSLRYTIDKTTREVLFLPLPTALKYRAKPFVDVTVDRLAKALGALMILVLIKPWGLGLDWQRLSLASLVVMAIWIGVALVARKEYLLTFRRSLGARAMTPGAVRLDVADASTIETLVEELSSPDEAAVLYSIELLETLDRRNLITPLLRYHPSAKVRARALEAVASASTGVHARWSQAIDAMLGDEDADVRAAAVGAVALRRGEDAATSMRSFLDDPDPRVVVTAATVLAASAREDDVALAEAAFKRLMGDGAGSPAHARREVAAGLARIPRPEFRPLLLSLIQDPDREVAREAIRSVCELGGADPLFVPALVTLLADRVHKREAREALVACGPAVVDRLVYFLDDRDESPWVRRHIPATLARFGTQQAMDALGRALDDRDGFLRFKALEAIEVLHRSHGSLVVAREVVEGLIRREVARYANCLTLRHNLVTADPEAVQSLLTRALDDKMGRILDRIYRMLGLLYPWKDVVAARFTIEHGLPRARASALEYLDNLIAGPLRRRVLPILDDASPEDRLRHAHLIIRSRPRALEETLVQLVHDDDQVIAAAAIHYVGQHHIASLTDDLEYGLEHRPATDRYAFGAASWVLGARHQDGVGRGGWMEPLPAVELVNRVRNLPLFREVFVDEVFRIVEAGRQVGYERGRTVYQASAPASTVQILVAGSVRAHDGQGIDHAVEAPAALAIDVVLAGRSIAGPIEAIDRVVAVEITGPNFLATVADSTPLARALFRMFLEQTDPVEWSTDMVPARPAGADLQPLDKVFLLRAHPLFGRATVDQCLQIVAITREVPLIAGTTILDEREPPAIYIIVSGAVRLEAAGRTDIVADRGHTVGVAEALGDASRGWRATVVADGRALYLDPDELFAVLGEHPDLIRSLLSGVLAGRSGSPPAPDLG